MKYQMLVDAPSGAQEIVYIEESGGYFDPSRVVWDERTDGTMPAITLGGMVRVGKTLEFSQARMDQSNAALRDVPSEVTYRQGMAVLIKYGIDTQIDAALNDQLSQAQASGDANAILAAKLAINDWKHSTAFLRSWPLIEQMRVAFGWTQEYVDQLFIEADTL